MGLVSKYVQRLKSGLYRYRMQVPGRLRDAVGKGEIVRVLEESEKEALRAYPHVHAEPERLLTELKASPAGSIVPNADNNSPLEKHFRIERRIRELGFTPELTFGPDGLPEDEAGRSVLADILDSYPRDPTTDDPVGVTDEDAALVRALYSGAPAATSPTLDDAKKLYLQEKTETGVSEEKLRELTHRANRVINHAKEVWHGGQCE